MYAEPGIKYLHRRSPEIEREISRHWAPPIQIDGFLSPKECKQIWENCRSGMAADFEQNGRKLRADNFLIGPFDSHLRYPELGALGERIAKIFPERCAIDVCTFFRMDAPSYIHADSGLNPDAKIYKIVQILLDIEPADAFSGVVFFQQRHTGFKTRFVHGSPGKEEFSVTGQYQLYEPYRHLHGFNENRPFDRAFYEKYLTHLPYAQLNGLTLDCMIESKIGKLIAPDTAQLHTSTDWARFGVRSKAILFLSYCLI